MIVELGEEGVSDLKEATFKELFEEMESRCAGIVIVCDTENQDGVSITRTWYGDTQLPYAEGLMRHALRGIGMEDEIRLKEIFNEADDEDSDG